LSRSAYWLNPNLGSVRFGVTEGSGDWLIKLNNVGDVSIVEISVEKARGRGKI
jgi:hypothetical protein